MLGLRIQYIDNKREENGKWHKIGYGQWWFKEIAVITADEQ